MFQLADVFRLRRPEPLKGLKANSGELLTNDNENTARREEHHSETLSATLVDAIAEECPYTQPVCENNSWWPTVDDVLEFILSLDGKCALGPDGISATYLKLAPETFACQVHALIIESIKTERAPLGSVGLDCATFIAKERGSSLDCDQYRGLSVTKHVAKIFTGLLYQNIEVPHLKGVDLDQYRATAGQCGAYAAHTLRTFLEVMVGQGTCYFALFLDLSKAFDFAIREVLGGWRKRL